MARSAEPETGPESWNAPQSLQDDRLALELAAGWHPSGLQGAAWMQPGRDAMPGTARKMPSDSIGHNPGREMRRQMEHQADIGNSWHQAR